MAIVTDVLFLILIWIKAMKTWSFRDLRTLKPGLMTVFVHDGACLNLLTQYFMNMSCLQVPFIACKLFMAAHVISAYVWVLEHCLSSTSVIWPMIN